MDDLPLEGLDTKDELTGESGKHVEDLVANILNNRDPWHVVQIGSRLDGDMK